MEVPLSDHWGLFLAWLGSFLAFALALLAALFDWTKKENGIRVLSSRTGLPIPTPQGKLMLGLLFVTLLLNATVEYRNFESAQSDKQAGEAKNTELNMQLTQANSSIENLRKTNLENFKAVQEAQASFGTTTLQKIGSTADLLQARVDALLPLDRVGFAILLAKWDSPDGSAGDEVPDAFPGPKPIYEKSSAIPSFGREFEQYYATQPAPKWHRNGLPCDGMAYKGDSSTKADFYIPVGDNVSIRLTSFYGTEKPFYSTDEPEEPACHISAKVVITDASGARDLDPGVYANLPLITRGYPGSLLVVGSLERSMIESDTVLFNLGSVQHEKQALFTAMRQATNISELENWYDWHLPTRIYVLTNGVQPDGKSHLKMWRLLRPYDAVDENHGGVNFHYSPDLNWSP